MVFRQLTSPVLRMVLHRVLLAAALSVAASAVQASPRVVVSIAPVHALVAAVMDGVGAPALLIPVGTSPHAYALRPSQRRIIDSAQLLVWVGANLEPFLVKPIGELGRSVRVIELMAQDTVHRSALRAAGVFASRGHDGLERLPGVLAEPHADKAPPAAQLGVRPDHDHGSAHIATDSHVWLDPDNAIAIVNLVARALIEQDPSSSSRYTDNARQMIERIRALDWQIDSLLASVRDVPYVVFHDAFQGFERHYRLHPVAAIAESSARMPGTRRVLEIRRLLAQNKVRCVFSEPQYQTRQLEALTEGLDVRRGVLDPLGRAHTPHANGWLELMLALAKNLHSCLSAPSS